MLAGQGVDLDWGGHPGQDRAAGDQRRRLRDPGAHPGARLRPHERRDVLRATVALEALEVETQRPYALPQVWVVGMGGVLEERRVELPEAALERRCRP